MKKYVFPLVLAIALTVLSPAVGHSDPVPTSQPDSTSGIQDQIPSQPPQTSGPISSPSFLRY